MRLLPILLLVFMSVKSTGETMYEEFNDVAVFGEIDKVNELLEGDNSLVNAKDEYGFTVLHNVVGEHNFDMVELLVQKGADVNAQNDEGIAPPHLAAYAENAKILIKNGAKVDIESNLNETPLYVATTEHEDIDVMEVLLENGANPNHKNVRGETPYDAAKLMGYTEKVALIEKYEN